MTPSHRHLPPLTMSASLTQLRAGLHTAATEIKQVYHAATTQLQSTIDLLCQQLYNPHLQLHHLPLTVPTATTINHRFPLSQQKISDVTVAALSGDVQQCVPPWIAQWVKEHDAEWHVVDGVTLLLCVDGVEALATCTSLPIHTLHTYTDKGYTHTTSEVLMFPTSLSTADGAYQLQGAVGGLLYRPELDASHTAVVIDTNPQRVRNAMFWLLSELQVSRGAWNKLGNSHSPIVVLAELVLELAHVGERLMTLQKMAAVIKQLRQLAQYLYTTVGQQLTLKRMVALYHELSTLERSLASKA